MITIPDNCFDCPLAKEDLGDGLCLGGWSKIVARQKKVGKQGFVITRDPVPGPECPGPGEFAFVLAERSSLTLPQDKVCPKIF